MSIRSQGDMVCGGLRVGGCPIRTEHQLVNHQRHAAATFPRSQAMPSYCALQRKTHSVSQGRKWRSGYALVSGQGDQGDQGERRLFSLPSVFPYSAQYIHHLPTNLTFLRMQYIRRELLSSGTGRRKTSELVIMESSLLILSV